MRTPRLRLVGCGSLDAGDDTIGLVLAESLRGQLPPEVEVKVDTAGGINLLAWCEGIQTLVLLDAALADGNFPTGQWRRLTFPDDQPCLKQLALRGTHAFGIGEALELARQLCRLPREAVICAVAEAAVAEVILGMRQPARKGSARSPSSYDTVLDSVHRFSSSDNARTPP